MFSFIISNSPPIHDFDDIGRLRQVTHKMLDRIEAALDEKCALEEKAVEAHQRIFGKTSLADTLLTLGELFMKLEKIDKREVSDTSSSTVLNSADVALVEAFVAKLKD